MCVRWVRVRVRARDRVRVRARDRVNPKVNPGLTLVNSFPF